MTVTQLLLLMIDNITNYDISPHIARQWLLINPHNNHVIVLTLLALSFDLIVRTTI